MDQGITFKTRRILKDAGMSSHLEMEGYSIFPFLEKNDLEALSQYYFDSQIETPEYFYSSTHSKDFSFRKRSSDFIKQIVSKKLDNYLTEYKLLGGAFVVKPPKGKGLLPPHQDWNIVDEQKGRSYNLWIPLVNVTVENGAMHVLKGSHNKIPTYRGPGIDSIFKNIEKEVWNELFPLVMNAGNALLYDHALLHASPVNQTNDIRLGIVCGVIPSDSCMQLHFNNGKNIVTHEATEDFFLETDPLNGPQGLMSLNNEFPLPKPLRVEEFNSIFLNKKQGTSWLNRLFGSGR